MSVELAMAIEAFARVHRAERALEKRKAELETRLACLTKTDVAKFMMHTEPKD